MLELPNRSLHPSDSFLITPDDIVLALEMHGVTNDVWEHPEDIILWHTHPSGGVGPSRQDMRNKVQHLQHMVVSLTHHGSVTTMY